MEKQARHQKLRIDSVRNSKNDPTAFSLQSDRWYCKGKKALNQMFNAFFVRRGISLLPVFLMLVRVDRQEAYPNF